MWLNQERTGKTAGLWYHNLQKDQLISVLDVRHLNCFLISGWRGLGVARQLATLSCRSVCLPLFICRGIATGTVSLLLNGPNAGNRSVVSRINLISDWFLHLREQARSYTVPHQHRKRITSTLHVWCNVCNAMQFCLKVPLFRGSECVEFITPRPKQ